MTNRNDLLQNYIAMLETGAPLDEVLSHLPDSDAPTRDLLQLVNALRAVPRPEPEAFTYCDSVVHRLIQERTGVQRKSFAPNSLRGWSMPRLALSGLALLILATFGLVWFTLLRGDLLPSSPLVVAASSGQVEMLRQDGTDWQPVRAGASLVAGQRLRSGPGSMATLQFSDGSRIQMAANSELSVVKLERSQNEALVVELMQNVGQTRHQVVSLRNPEAAYVVHTPAGRAEVRGTTFSVAVAADGHTYVAVDEGQVMVTSDGAAVAIAAGHATETRAGRAPAAPVRYFRSQGELRRQDNTLWHIDETLVYVTEETVLTDVFAIGDIVSVSGRILPNGRWQADSVGLAFDLAHQAAFAGVLQAMTPRLWLVDGISVEVTADTGRPADLAPGDLAHVIYVRTEDGHRKALQIVALPRVAPDTLEPTERPTDVFQVARPSLDFDPDELEADGCQTTYTLTGLLTNSGDSAQDVASNVEVGYTVLSGARFVEMVTIDPSGWETIAAGETASFSVQVDVNAAWLDAPPETEVKLRLFIAAESNRPGHYITRLTLTLIQTCDQPARAPTGTPTPVQPSVPTPVRTPRVPKPAPSATPTATRTAPVPTPTPGSTDCVGGVPHPEGLRLAQVYGVPYAEIIGWFCEGFGFGEIDLAYGLSRDTGTEVADIFAMRRDGLGWGEIMEILGVQPGPPAPTGPPVIPSPQPTTGQPSPPPTVTPGLPTVVPTATKEPDEGPPITIPAPSMTPPTPPVAP